jgi:small subunit ribosomal protein S1
VLSKRKADRIRGWERVIQKHKVGDTVKGKCVRKIKGGLLVDVGVLVFLPASQVDIRRVGDVGEYIGRDIEAKIIKIDEERRNIVLSRRKLLEEDRDKMKKELFTNIRIGEIRRGGIAHPHKEACHLLGVIFVHLAAPGLDVQTLSHRAPVTIPKRGWTVKR